MSKDSPPPPSKHWRSASQARDTYASGYKKINRKLETLGDEIILELVSTGRISPEDAAFVVSKTLVGLRRNPKGGRVALHGSLVAFDMLDLEKKEDAPPSPSDGWKSASQLRWDSKIGGNVKFTRQMVEIRDTVTASLIEAGLSQEDAAMIVDKTLVGERKPKSGGVSCLYASPITQEMMQLKTQQDKEQSR